MDRSPPHIFDRRRAAAKWARARARHDRGGASYLYDTLVDDILDRLDFMRFSAERAFVLGDQSGMLAQALKAKGAEVSTAMLGEFDEERPGAASAYDLIIHLLGPGTINDLPGALIHARHSLAEGGLFIGGFLGAGSVPTLRRLALAADGDRPAPRIHPQVDNRAATGLLERAGFSRQVVDTYPLKVRYSSIERMISDLRAHGLTSSLATRAPVLTRSAWDRARAEFEALKDGDGKVTEHFEFLLLTGWR